VEGDVELEQEELTGVRWTGSQLGRLHLTDVTFVDCDLSGVVLDDGSWLRVRFTRCRLSGLVAPDLRATAVVLEDCKLDDAWLRMSIWERSALRDCDLTAADLYGSRWKRSQIVRSRLDGAQLSTARLDSTAVHGSTFTGTLGLTIDVLRGAIVATDQLLSLAPPLLTAAGLVVDDEWDDTPTIL
jgi:uncharacterized protein YjbI with pentapeptide repeats